MLAEDELPIDERSVEFFRNLLTVADQGDLTTCQTMLEKGKSLGLRTSDLVITALSSILNDVGSRWEAGAITDADERRVTRWCLAFLEQVPLPSSGSDQLDLVAMAATNNIHNVGLKLAEYVIRERGLGIEILPNGSSMDEIFQKLQSSRARHFVISCALPTMIQEALDVFAELSRRGYGGSMVLTGACVRRMQSLHDLDHVQCVNTVWEMIEMLVAARPASTARAGQNLGH